MKVEYGGAASDYAGDLLLLPFWSDKDIDVVLMTSIRSERSKHSMASICQRHGRQVHQTGAIL